MSNLDTIYRFFNNQQRAQDPFAGESARATGGRTRSQGQPAPRRPDEPYGEATRAATDKIIEKTHIDARSRVMDIGSGRGRLLFHIAEKAGCSCYGVELDGFRAGLAAAAKQQLSAHPHNVQSANRVTTVQGNATDAQHVSHFKPTHVYMFDRAMDTVRPAIVAILAQHKPKYVLSTSSALENALGMRKVDSIQTRISASTQGFTLHVYASEDAEASDDESEDQARSRSGCYQCLGNTKRNTRCSRMTCKHAPYCWQHSPVSVHAGGLVARRDLQAGQRIAHYNMKGSIAPLARSAGANEQASARVRRDKIVLVRNIGKGEFVLV